MRRSLKVKASSPQKWQVASALELIFAEHPLPMWVFDQDTLRFLAVNETAVATYGYSRQEFMEMCLTDIHVAEDIRDVLRDVAGVDGKGKSARRWRHRLRGGTIINVEVTAHSLKLDGRRGIFAVTQDITGRLAQESKREQTTTYLKALIENSPVAIVVYDTNGRVEFCNPAFEQLFQYRQEEVAGAYLDHLVVPAALRPEADEITRSSVAGKATHITTVRQRKDGTLIDVEIHGVPLTIRGNSVGAYRIYQDIRERKRLEEQLQFAQKMQAVGRLAGGIAHDFNNIMGVIQGYSEYLLEFLEAGHPMRTNVEEIDKAARRAVGLTSQLLAFSRKQVLQLRVLDLNSILADMEGMLRRLIREDIQLTIVPCTNLAGIRADPVQLEQVILNLTVNARDAMPSGGKLIIETGNVELNGNFNKAFNSIEPGHYVMLTVSDTGKGMDADTLKHLFEPFFTTKEQGTGLGLATVYGIVRQSSGHIFATSERGRGTTFTIYLPRVEESTAGHAVNKPEEATPRGKGCILLVEDEESFRRLVRKFLQDCGYIVLEAKDGKAAMRVSEAFPGPIDLLLTDVVMPNMSGQELAEALALRRPETKLLFMSGYAADEKLPSFILRRGATLIQKPFNRSFLAQRVRQLIGARK